MAPGSAAHRRRDAALRPGHESGVLARNCINAVIASAAKQSRVSPRKESGLLRRFAPRNDGVWGGGHRSFDSHLTRRHIYSFSRLISPELCLVVPPS
ncbi:hypothetical protein D6B98_16790 [Bradyrhizobium sp. LVM 105]|uniref:Uncharacterized protein n=1 Tax=Bradyrhizobium frederickii TaxID=2560054 RepID=A0A4Y9L1P0_9BRAD|nr:hypothetical protein D6B98_16790 [Bradyrhizobium sp. LVM 105]TFV37478.1 hypothetical protein E4K66_18240 [Bradyrhizobium frederickii]